MQNKFIKDDIQYRVGGLLYTPALNDGIVAKIVNHELKNLTSLALCLEDSISDDSLEKAEEQLKNTLTTLSKSSANLPLLFVRVRSADHLAKIHTFLGEVESILKTVADIGNRVDILWSIKHHLDTVHDYILNVRVGGNDFSNMYGLRRTETQNIYQIGVIRDILVNIINVFASDYVVSGPVWEYFGTDDSKLWADGLRKELELDQLNGFIGKTAIHPSQLPIIYESLKVRKCDYDDAYNIVNWSANSLAVAKSSDGQRMNEVKCHLKWARKILTLAEIYGVREE